jgi:hypothetical protein
VNRVVGLGAGRRGRWVCGGDKLVRWGLIDRMGVR